LVLGHSGPPSGTIWLCKTASTAPKIHPVRWLRPDVSSRYHPRPLFLKFFGFDVNLRPLVHDILVKPRFFVSATIPFWLQYATVVTEGRTDVCCALPCDIGPAATMHMIGKPMAVVWDGRTDEEKLQELLRLGEQTQL